MNGKAIDSKRRLHIVLDAVLLELFPKNTWERLIAQRYLENDLTDEKAVRVLEILERMI